MKPQWDKALINEDRIWVCEECRAVFDEEERVKDCLSRNPHHKCKAKKFKKEHYCESYMQPFIKQV